MLRGRTGPVFGVSLSLSNFLGSWSLASLNREDRRASRRHALAMAEQQGRSESRCRPLASLGTARDPGEVSCKGRGEGTTVNSLEDMEKKRAEADGVHPRGSRNGFPR